MTVAVRGAELYYSVRGTGPTCFVLSAIGTKPYERLMPAALSDFLQLVFIDLRGGGKSTGDPADLTFDVLAEDLDAIRLALGVERVLVLGHSILGVLAIEYGRRRPAHVSHVIAVGTPPHGDMVALSASANAFFAEDASAERQQLLRDNRALLPPNASLRQTMQAQTPTRYFDANLDTAPLFAESEVKVELMQHLMGTLTPDWEVTANASELHFPILVAHGRYDYTVPHTMWEPVIGRLPLATLQRFERSGHHPFFEEPEQFANVLASWMANTAGVVRPDPKESSEDAERAAIRQALDRMTLHEQPTTEVPAVEAGWDETPVEAGWDEAPVKAGRDATPVEAGRDATPVEAGWDDDFEDPRAHALVEELGLEPHPEGGHYRQVYRSKGRVQPADDRPARASLTTIYFLLTSGTHSRWHRVQSDEAWHFYEGGPIELLVADPELRRIERVTLGSLASGNRPVYVVPAGWWQAARPVGTYGLVGCTVAPGFEFDDFSFLRDDAAAEAALRALDPTVADLV